MLKQAHAFALYVGNNDKDSKFNKIGYHVRIAKYEKHLRKVSFHIGQKQFLLSKELKILYHGQWDFNDKEIAKNVYVKENTKQKHFRFEKVLKGDNSYVRWKGYDNSFNS